MEEEAAPPPPGPKVLDIAGKTTLEILAQIDIFSGLPPMHLRRVVDIGVEETYKAGATVFQEGEAGDKFYLILEGAVRISRFVPGMGEEALAVLRPGAYFGEMSLIDDAPRSATALAHAPDTTVVVIDKADLDRLLLSKGEAAHELLQILCRLMSARLREINDKIVQWRMMSGGGF